MKHEVVSHINENKSKSKRGAGGVMSWKGKQP